MKKELEKFARQYAIFYGIKIDGITLETYSLKKLYGELETLRKEQEQNSEIEKILQSEVDKYVYYAGYDVIKNLILAIKENILKKYKENQINIEEAKELLNKQVLEEFKAYYKRLETLNEFKKMTFRDLKLEQMIKDLEANIANPGVFKILEKRIINYITGIMLIRSINNNKEKIYMEKNYNKEKEYIIDDKYYKKKKIK